MLISFLLTDPDSVVQLSTPSLHPPPPTPQPQVPNKTAMEEALVWGATVAQRGQGGKLKRPGKMEADAERCLIAARDCGQVLEGERGR